jgi:hypothetical protein
MASIACSARPSKGGRSHGRAKKHIDQNIVEVRQKAQDSIAPWGFGKSIGAMLLETLLRLVLTKSLRRGVKGREAICDRARMGNDAGAGLVHARCPSFLSVFVDLISTHNAANRLGHATAFSSVSISGIDVRSNFLPPDRSSTAWSAASRTAHAAWVALRAKAKGISTDDATSSRVLG